ncbi:hypothetical protein HWV62_1965 [Athelia sp. TMB]|nr:hypothetical protein HWV62_1965 [Athelia sp. TMB]
MGPSRQDRLRNASRAHRAEAAAGTSDAVYQPSVSYEEEDFEMQEMEGSDQSPHQTVPEPVEESESDLSRSIADRRRRRQVQVPLKFVDFVPQPLADEIDPSSPPTPSPIPSLPASPAVRSAPTPVLEELFIDTAQNLYGLYRRFTGRRLPTHDPESGLKLSALTDAALTPSGTAPPPDSEIQDVDTQHSLYPFDNENAFLIGEWLYSDNASISLKRFRQLLGIIGDSKFKPEDIRNTDWDKIHKILGSNTLESEESFLDEPAEWHDVDAGWRRKPVSIQVPFHRQTDDCGNHRFTVGDFYHRKLMDVIREKLSNPTDDAQFHYEPYELRWQPKTDGASSTRVHGEFYTSPAFRSAHEELQAADNEPGCSLQKVVLGMAFASDGVQLTHFGNAKLVLIASIRDKGRCPCPRCTLSIAEVEHLGTPEDIVHRAHSARLDNEEYRRTIEAARKLILEEHHAVDSKEVESLLKFESLTPTANAFSRKLGPHGFNVFKALLPDLMHEVEIGGWKALFIHLLRILEVHNKTTRTTLKEFNRRFRQIPSFGRDAIRRFVNNVSDLKQLAARDYEDLLQCSIPVFDGLLPEPHNSTILSLLFTFAHWHGLAKLRMHTDPSVALLEAETEELYAQLRYFATSTCEAFDTYELKRELDARQRAKQRRNQKKADLAPVSTAGKESIEPLAPVANSETLGLKKKKFNLNTVKFHFLPDYPATIREFGTTDSYSTEPPELENRKPKKRYTRTSHKMVKKQLAAMERRHHRIRRIRTKLYGNGKAPADDERIPAGLDIHHYIGKTENDPIDIGGFLGENTSDPAILNFYKKLKVHLMPRVLSKLREKKDIDLGRLPQIEHCDPDIFVSFHKNHMYEHRILRVNYTTYDVRRDQDLINSHSTHCNIMQTQTQAQMGPAPIDMGAFSAHTISTSATTGQVGRIMNYTGWKSFGSAATELVILYSPKMIKIGKNITLTGNFVDRDMLMRYHLGLGIGHVYGHSSYVSHSLHTATTDSTSIPTASRNPTTLSIRDINMEASGGNDSDSDSGGSLDLDNDDWQAPDNDDLLDTNISDIEENELFVEDMYS